MEKDYSITLSEHLNSDFKATEEPKDEMLARSADNSISKAALIAYLLS